MCWFSGICRRGGQTGWAVWGSGPHDGGSLVNCVPTVLFLFALSSRFFFSKGNCAFEVRLFRANGISVHFPGVLIMSWNSNPLTIFPNMLRVPGEGRKGKTRYFLEYTFQSLLRRSVVH
jgi:hypothetical protein